MSRSASPPRPPTVIDSRDRADSSQLKTVGGRVMVATTLHEIIAGG